MKTDVFPINYFNSIWSPIRAFKNRHQLNWFHIIVVLIFLNALMLIPVTLNYAKSGNLPLEDFYPNVLELIDGDVVNELANAKYENGEMLFSDSFVIESESGIVAGGVSKEILEGTESSTTFLLFEENKFLISEEGLPTSTILYTRDFTLEDVRNSNEVQQELSRQWSSQNNVLIVFTFSMMIGVFLLVMLVLLVFGSAFILYMTKKGSMTSISTYKESVNLLVNALAIPSILAMLFGLFYFDIFLMISIQTIGLLVMLLVIFYKTQFNDQKAAKL